MHMLKFKPGTVKGDSSTIGPQTATIKPMPVHCMNTQLQRYSSSLEQA